MDPAPRQPSMGSQGADRAHECAAVVSIGDELTLGQKLDTNSQWISRRLVDRGVVVREHVTLDDDAGAIACALERLSHEADLIVVTGGLGPTADDLTRDALARVLGEDLIEDASALAALGAWYASRGREMPPTNRVQALRPASGRCLPNDRGTAPGLWARTSLGVDVFCLPGPPAEMRPMFEREVLPALRLRGDRVVRTAILHTVGMGESTIAEILGELMDRSRCPLVGTTASRGVVSCRVRYEGSPAHAESLMARTLDAIRSRLGSIVFGEGDQTLEGACLDLLRARSRTLCTIESCTGGMLGEVVTAMAGASDAYVGGWVTYANGLKRSLVGVPESVLARSGAVSAACARAMALGGLDRAGATHALSITGIAGPGGGSEDKPVGTVWIAHAQAGGPGRGPSVDARRFLFRGDRDSIRAWTVVSALAMLRQGILSLDAPLLGEMERV